MPVVGKEVCVVEEISIRKEAADRVETLREMQVDIEDASATPRGRPARFGPASPRRRRARRAWWTGR